MLLKELSELNGVSGNESKIRKFIIEEIKNHVDDVKVDKIGNIIAYKKGNNEARKIMVSTHMDEVGLIVNSINSEGLLGFTLVGDIDNRILISKPVLVGDKEIQGVIGAKPIHLQKREERKKALDYSELYIDIGTSSKEQSEKLVSIGDYVSFKSEFIEFGDNLLKGKALENRAGCSVLIDILKKETNTSFYAVFSVMKEIGIFGGQPAAYSISPDVNIILDSHSGESKLGNGPVFSFMEKGGYFDSDLTKQIASISKQKNIPHQICGPDDKSDASVAQISGYGSKAIKLSIPCKYRRSAVTVVNKEDLNNMKILLEEALSDIGGKII